MMLYGGGERLHEIRRKSRECNELCCRAATEGTRSPDGLCAAPGAFRACFRTPQSLSKAIPEITPLDRNTTQLKIQVQRISPIALCLRGSDVLVFLQEDAGRFGNSDAVIPECGKAPRPYSAMGYRHPPPAPYPAPRFPPCCS